MQSEASIWHDSNKMRPPHSHAGWSGAPVCGGAYSNPRQKYTDAKTVQLRAPMPPNPRGPDKEAGDYRV